MKSDRSSPGFNSGKIENSFKQIEGLHHGVARLLGLKQEVAAAA
jgi:hypothetical protein